VREKVVTKSRSGPVYAYIIPLKVGNVRRGKAVVGPFSTSDALRMSKTLTIFIGPICTEKPRLGTHAFHRSIDNDSFIRGVEIYLSHGNEIHLLFFSLK
jgi:hypothetical protein